MTEKDQNWLVPYGLRFCRFFPWNTTVWIKQCSELAGIALVVKLENGPPETSKGQWRPRIFAWLPNFTDLTNGTFFSPTIEFLLKLKRTDETQLDIYNRKLHTDYYKLQGRVNSTHEITLFLKMIADKVGLILELAKDCKNVCINAFF